MARWSRGPDTTAANGSLYGDYAFPGYSVVDDADRVYFCQFPATASEVVFLRLDPPYTEWFTMWAIVGFDGASEFMELQAQGNGIVLLGGSGPGSGGERYDGDADLGEAANDGSWGPWEPNPYQPTAFGNKTPTWATLLGGDAESGLQYFASAKDSTGRIWFVENLGYTGSGNMAGYLDGIEPVRVADMQTGPTLDGFTACCDKSDRLIVAGPSDLSGKVWRYTPGSLVGAGIHEVQRVQPSGSPLVTSPAIFNLDTEAVNAAENLAQTQAHYDYNLGAGVVTLTGTGADHNVTWDAAGARSKLTSLFATVTTLQHGTGYPSTDAWESLDDLPAGITRGVIISDRLSPEGIHYIGGKDNSGGVSTHYRWREVGGWQQLPDMPFGLTTISDIGTQAESRPAYLMDNQIVVCAYSLDATRCAVVGFDLRAQRWGSPVYTDFNHQRGGFAVTSTHAVMIGGTDELGNPTSVVERIRLATLHPLHLGSLSWRSEA